MQDRKSTVIETVNNLSALIQKYNQLMIATDEFSFRFIATALSSNPIMAGRIGKERDDLKQTQKEMQLSLVTLKKLLQLNDQQHQGYIQFLQQRINECTKKTIAALHAEGNGLLGEIIDHTSRIHLEEKNKNDQVVPSRKFNRS